VREYNRGWDYFAGMDPQQIETYNRSATVWERPSWPMGDWQQREQDLHDAIRREFFGDTATEMPAGPPMSQAEKDAMAVLELRPPVSFVDIKAQYRILVKKHHPDANAGSRAAEEKFKILNQAFTVLKEIYDSDES
jgi:DnaJ-domain-containing protein 1